MRALLRGAKSLARDAIAQTLFRTGLSQPERVCRGSLAIATFHRVLPAEVRATYAFPGLIVTPEELDFFLSFFEAHFTLTTMTEAFERFSMGSAPAKPLLAVTFDDGQLDNFEYARPVLERHGVRGSFYITVDATDANRPLWHDQVGFAAHVLESQSPARLASLLEGKSLEAALERAKRLPTPEREAWVERWTESVEGESRPDWDAMMSWDQIRALRDAGHEIGSHSRTHPILPNCDTTRLRAEIIGSRERLEEELNTPVTSFCYPNGDTDDRVASVVREAGYQVAVTTDWGWNPRGSDRYRLQRWDIQSDTSRSITGALSPSRLAMRFAFRNIPGARQSAANSLYS